MTLSFKRELASPASVVRSSQMLGVTMATVARSPSEFSPEEIDDFVAFVLAGGEVTAQGLRDHVV